MYIYRNTFCMYSIFEVVLVVVGLGWKVMGVSEN
jgi:hypothetical protein